MPTFSLRSRDFILVCLCSFLYFGSFYLLLPTLPQFVAGLGGSVSQIGLVTGAMTLASVVIRPWFGRLSDSVGRKRVMAVGAAAFALLFLPYMLLEAIFPLFFVRIIHGVAHGAYLAAVFAYVADLAPPERRGEVMGVFGVANVVAMAAFPAAGAAIIAATDNYRLLFTLSLVSAGLAALAACGVSERRPQGARGPAKLLDVARQPAVLAASLTFFCAATVYGAVISFLPVYAPQQGITNVGLFFSMYAVFTLISRLAAGKLSDRYGRRVVVLPFMALLAVATFLLSRLNGVPLLCLTGACFGLGFGAFMPALNAFVVDHTRPGDRAGALAFFTSFMDIGITTGAIVLGAAGDLWGYSLMFALAGLLPCAGFALFALFTARAARPA